MVTESGEASLTTPVADADVVARTDGRVAVIGLGYTGLPLAIAFIEAGLQVEAIDANLLRVAELSQRRSPIDDISDERLGAALDAGLRVVGVDDGRLGDADAVFVCVPTPVTATKDPDLTADPERRRRTSAAISSEAS